jgi:hypothetical protein
MAFVGYSSIGYKGRVVHSPSAWRLCINFDRIREKKNFVTRATPQQFITKVKIAEAKVIEKSYISI